MTIFVDGQYFIYAGIVGGSEKAQKYADGINGWSIGKKELSGPLLYYDIAHCTYHDHFIITFKARRNSLSLF